MLVEHINTMIMYSTRINIEFMVDDKFLPVLVYVLLAEGSTDKFLNKSPRKREV